MHFARIAKQATKCQYKTEPTDYKDKYAHKYTAFKKIDLERLFLRFGFSGICIGYPVKNSCL